MTDDSGKFQFTGARSSLPSSFALSASNGGRTGQAPVGPDQMQATVALQAAARATGHVSGSSPVKGFTITVSQSGGGWPGRFGNNPLEFAGDTFQLDDVPPGPAQVSVKTQDGRIGQAAAQLTSGQSSQIEVQLQDSTSVTGRVVSTVDGKPVSSAMVAADSSFSGGVLTSADGRFTLSNLSIGDHTLTVVLQPARSAKQPFTVAAGPALDLGDVQLGPPKADPGTIGAQLRPDGQGVVVAYVLPQGPADQGGLKVADEVAAIDGVPVTNAQDATTRSRGTPGSTTAIAVRRGGSPLSISIVRAAQ
jgi:hypothetical protein